MIKRFTDEPLQWCDKCESSTEHKVDDKHSDDTTTAFRCIECGTLNEVPLKIAVPESEADFFSRPI